MNDTSPINPSSPFPPFRQRLGEIVPLVGFVPVAGPPAIFILAPWLALVLMLAGPFLLLVTLAAIALCAAVFVPDRHNPRGALSARTAPAQTRWAGRRCSCSARASSGCG
jgi:hypothetical protein